MKRLALLFSLLIAPTLYAQSGPWQFGGGGGTSSYPSLTNLPFIDPRAYGAKFNAGFNSAMTTNGTTTLTCSGCKWLTGTVGTNTPPAAAGQVLFLTLSASGNPGGNNACLDNALITIGGSNQGTVASVQSDTSLTMSGVSGTTATALVCGAWGTDDTTALNNSQAAGGCQPVIHAPVGNTIFSAPIFQNPAGCTGGVGNGYTGTSIWGAAVGDTDFIPTPGFTYTSLIGNASTLSAFGGTYVQDYENFTVFGLGVRAPAALQGDQVTLNLCSGPPGCREINVALVGWDARPQSGSGNSVFCLGLGDSTNGFNFSGYNYCGSTAVWVNQNVNNITWGNSFISGNASATTGTCPVLVWSGSSVVSIGNLIQGCVGVGQASGAVTTLTSVNTTVSANDSGGGFCMYMQTNAVVNLLGNDSVCGGATGTESAVDFQSTGAVYRMHGSTHVGASGAVFTFTGAASNVIVDEGGNSYTAGGSGIWNALGTWTNKAQPNEVGVTAAKLVLSAGFGSTAAVTALTGGDNPIGFTITNSGTGQTNPATITYTFPTAYVQAPLSCTATQIGGTNPTLTFTAGTPSKTSVVFTTTGTSPTVSDTEIMQASCVSP